MHKVFKAIYALAAICLLTGCTASNPSPKPLTTSSPSPKLSPTPSVTPTVSPTPTPTPSPTPEPTPEPTPTPKPTPIPIAEIVLKPLELPDGVKDPYSITFGSPFRDDGELSNESYGWGYYDIVSHTPPKPKNVFDIRLFDGYHLGDFTDKNIYLTFDEGYEYGYTPSILDTLKEKGVQAAFFLTKSFIRDNPTLVIRMVEEGHVIANHSVRHLQSSTLTAEELAYEILEVARYCEEITGYELTPFFRPPEGEYSAQALETIRQLGYKSIFWSLHHHDYLVDNQPGKELTFDRITSKMHPGCILLLHAVSQSNTEALPDIIDFLLDEGYTFKSLYDLPEHY